MMPNTVKRWSTSADTVVMANAIAANASIKNTLVQYIKKNRLGRVYRPVE